MTSSTDAALLDVRGLTVAYRTSEGPLPAVRGVDLVVGKGEIVGVAGESGCGKSTLVSTVLRLQPRDATVSGEVADPAVFHVMTRMLSSVFVGRVSVPIPRVTTIVPFATRATMAISTSESTVLLAVPPGRWRQIQLYM